MLGPAFFILIETSIKKGFKAAIFLDIGIILSDAIYLLAAFFVAEKIILLHAMQKHGPEKWDEVR